jgi:hypothetical protein
MKTAARIRFLRKQLRKAEAKEYKALKSYQRAQVKAQNIALEVATLQTQEHQRGELKHER